MSEEIDKHFTGHIADWLWLSDTSLSCVQKGDVMQRISSVAASVVLSTSLAVLLWTAPASALGGCVDSPENPSLLLALVGAAAALLPLVRRRLFSKDLRN
jgi:XrtJ-associated TM-motif-TM protein